MCRLNNESYFCKTHSVLVSKIVEFIVAKGLFAVGIITISAAGVTISLRIAAVHRDLNLISKRTVEIPPTRSEIETFKIICISTQITS